MATKKNDTQPKEKPGSGRNPDEVPYDELHARQREMHNAPVIAAVDEDAPNANEKNDSSEADAD